MITIGEYLKRERRKNDFSLNELSKKTKIRATYIEHIEKESWEKLPEFPVVQGFVKSISTHLKLDEKQSMALLRRDYPPKKLMINPKPDVSDKIKWNPKLAFTVGVIGVVILVFGYLFYQYLNFTAPPQLILEKPKEDEKVLISQIAVQGKTDPEATIKVNNQPILVEKDGSFLGEIEVYEGTEEIVVVARSRAGKEEIITRKINVELGDED
ncbi:helix-turn-helix domain-containing protein [Candidatus Woesebacteria bacterium]|nr:helix-turn-helix domain-containing protein [Candidatus Woesebacteria bacterium]